MFCKQNIVPSFADFRIGVHILLRKSVNLVEMRRIELLTPCLQGRCSPSWATPPCRVNLMQFGFSFCTPRTHGTQVWKKIRNAQILVGLSGLEPPTSRLSGVRSNRLSYRPMQEIFLGSSLIFSVSLSHFFNISLWMFMLFAYTFKDKQYKSSSYSNCCYWPTIGILVNIFLLTGSP